MTRAAILIDPTTGWRNRYVDFVRDGVALDVTDRQYRLKIVLAEEVVAVGVCTHDEVVTNRVWLEFTSVEAAKIAAGNKADYYLLELDADGNLDYPLSGSVRTTSGGPAW